MTAQHTFTYKLTAEQQETLNALLRGGN